jgi:UDP-glucuronate 4-epimerase
MRFAVTGATGFIGMHLVNHLVRNGHEVVYSCDTVSPIYGGRVAQARLANLDPELVNFEVNDLAAIKTTVLAEKIKNAEIVIHLAANAGVRQSALNPHEYSKSNLTAFSNVLEAVRLSKPKLFLFASSSSIYGQSTVDGPQIETSANGLNLASYYASTKWANEILAKSISKTFDINSVALRFFTVYGSFGRPDMAYWNFGEKILKSETIELYGADGGSRSFSHVSDVVAMIEQLAKSEKLRIDLHSSKDHFLALNIGSEKSVSALSMLNILGEQLKHKPFYEIANRPVFDVDRTWASMTKTYTYVESRNFMNLEDGLREFTNWFLNYSV